MAIDAAMKYVSSHPNHKIPSYLQDSHYKGAAKLGHGIGYQYAHEFENHYVDQQYLPDEIRDMKFYELSDMGMEKVLKEHLMRIKNGGSNGKENG